jgi:hypothetical protein
MISFKPNLNSLSFKPNLNSVSFEIHVSPESEKEFGINSQIFKILKLQKSLHQLIHLNRVVYLR